MEGVALLAQPGPGGCALVLRQRVGAHEQAVLARGEVTLPAGAQDPVIGVVEQPPQPFAGLVAEPRRHRTTVAGTDRLAGARCGPGGVRHPRWVPPASSAGRDLVHRVLEGTAGRTSRFAGNRSVAYGRATPRVGSSGNAGTSPRKSRTAARYSPNVTWPPTTLTVKPRTTSVSASRDASTASTRSSTWTQPKVLSGWMGGAWPSRMRVGTRVPQVEVRPGAEHRRRSQDDADEPGADRADHGVLGGRLGRRVVAPRARGGRRVPVAWDERVRLADDHVAGARRGRTPTWSTRGPDADRTAARRRRRPGCPRR